MKEFEALCLRCGKCCGAGGDPCAKLVKNDDGKYTCEAYDARLGLQLTVSGKPFTCVPINDVINKGMPNQACGYLTGNSDDSPKA